jgi:hypothetical protein
MDVATRLFRQACRPLLKSAAEADRPAGVGPDVN